jgi:hypothetical protein
MTTIKTQSQAPTADREDDLKLLTDRELDRVVGGQGEHYKKVTLAMRKSA